MYLNLQMRLYAFSDRNVFFNFLGSRALQMLAPKKSIHRGPTHAQIVGVLKIKTRVCASRREVAEHIPKHRYIEMPFIVH